GYDGLVLTSKNAVFALENSNISWQHLPAYVIGEGTKEAVLEAGGKIEFMAKEAYGDVLAKEIAPLLAKKHVLLVRAKEVVSDVVGYLRKNNVKVDEYIGYETKCLPCEKMEIPPPRSVLIFTSPSSIRCFLGCAKWDTSWEVVCIGKKTAKSLPPFVTPHMPSYQSVDECVVLAQRINENLSINTL
ncbi:MAG: uroporphyrinogen-III synthase, partial [Campylobacteraceae bacterium]|nr:uroporphyrinogen-III synthase [Campylobacteraceae bacterium]